MCDISSENMKSENFSGESSPKIPFPVNYSTDLM